MIRSLMLLALLATPALAQKSGGALGGHNANAPVDVTSDRSEVQDKQNRAVFVGNVHAVQGSMTLDAARVTVSYSKGANGGDLQIDRIDASGGVTVVDPANQQRAKGSFGIYDLNRKLITLIGGVTLVRRDNSVNGARLVMDLNTGRSTVDGSAVGGAGTMGSSGGRVTGHFAVPQKNQGTTTTPAPIKPAGK